jgi:SAM-dependent methyltransferase
MELENFWDTQHKEKNKWWLSGCYSGKDILKIHNINKNISNLKVLDLGVGMGNLTRYLNELGNEVYSCDISNVALDNIKDVAKTYHTSELKNIEAVDIAISNLVFQHCDDNEVRRIIKEIKLKDNGYFSFQFAFLRENENPTEILKENIKNKTHYFRSLDKILEFIDEANKTVISINGPIHHYGKENFSWYIVKIKNK